MKLKSRKEKVGISIIISTGIIAVIAVFFISPIHQNQLYHNFCDTNKLFGTPNFCNVISNFPFVIIGFFGLFRLSLISKFKWHYAIFFTGIILVGFGSGHYHLNPNNETLFWDRLPMTIVFMSLVSIIIGEFINEKTGSFMLIPTLIIGMFSVCYWALIGDLRFYAFVQFYPMLVIIVILTLFNGLNYRKAGYWLLIFMYIIAKFCEHFDGVIFEFTKIISGHTLKHIISALGLFLFIKVNLKHSKPINPIIVS